MICTNAVTGQRAMVPDSKANASRAMDRDDIYNTIRMLSFSQGSYGRMLHSLDQLRQEEPDKYDEVMTELENQNFHDPVDLVMYLEC